MTSQLPIFSLRTDFLAALSVGPVVVSSPTGSGKSTELPRWCEGPVLVVEPRRVACRSLAARVAELDGTPLGERVGYVVRDERLAGPNVRIVFATPGIVLRQRGLLAAARTVVLDEFHERGLETDLLLALLVARKFQSLVVMSATLDGERVAKHVGGTHLTAEGRAFPVDVRHLEQGAARPDANGLPARVRTALEQSAGDPGDVLVFLPGKAEIDACMQELRRTPHELVPLHGGLRLDEQRRAFAPASRRKVILATNVAETSLTIPGVGVVIDSGLVRQTRYHEGRGHLALVPISADSASQRAGRAGRMAAGVCYRLWSPLTRLEKSTPPEILRESLVPLVLSAAAWGKRVEELPLLDPATPHALAAARADLAAWDALDADGALNATGHDLFALPVEAGHARLLLEAGRRHCLDDMIDLVAVLSVGRPLFSTPTPDVLDDDDLRAGGCDASAFIRALRVREPELHGASPFVLAEARLARARLRSQAGLEERAPHDVAIDREALREAALAADARMVHVARRRGRELGFSNGGTELELARESALKPLRELDAVIVLDTRAFGLGREARVLITCAMPITLAAMARAGLGRDRVGAVRLEGRRVLAEIERVYAKRVIATREDTPTGELARAALCELIVRGSLFKKAMQTTRERLTRTALAAQLARRGHPAGVLPSTPVLAVEDWVRARLETLGVESGDDLAMLSDSDFLAPDVPYEVQSALTREFPLEVSVGDASYRAEYDLERMQVLLHMVKGSRTTPPPLSYLPKFTGLRICVQGPRGIAVVRERG